MRLDSHERRDARDLCVYAAAAAATAAATAVAAAAAAAIDDEAAADNHNVHITCTNDDVSGFHRDPSTPAEELVPSSERQTLPLLYRLEESYYRRPSCNCGSVESSWDIL